MDKKSKNNPNLIEPIANKFKEIIVPTLPSFITTYNLTLISLIWSSSILYAGYKSQKNIKWLYLVILSIIYTIIRRKKGGIYEKVNWKYLQGKQSI